MGHVEKLIIREKEILIVDYIGSNQDEMIRFVKQAKDLILGENRFVTLLCVFNDKNYLTPRFLRQLESDYKEVEKYISKNAVIGLSAVQQWILKGVNMWTKRKIVHFDTREEAIQFLIDDPEAVDGIPVLPANKMYKT